VLLSGSSDSVSVPPDDAGAEGGGVSIVREAFEEGDCPGWDPSGVTRTKSALAHSGTGACRICARDSSEQSLKRVVPALGRGSYVLTAHVRAPDTGFVAAPNVMVFLSITSDAGTRSNPRNLTPTDAYEKGEAIVDFEIPVTGGEMFVILTEGPANRCALVDDVSLVHYP
jgi:hypothetical protein